MIIDDLYIYAQRGLRYRHDTAIPLSRIQSTVIRTFAIVLPQIDPYVISIKVLKLLSEIIFHCIWQLTHL
jgi:hypothetical protein